MFNARKTYVAIALLGLGYLVAVFILMAGIVLLSLGYLSVLALLGVFTARLAQKTLSGPERHEDYVQEHWVARRMTWNMVWIVFFALLLTNIGIFAWNLAKPIEGYVPIPEVVALVLFLLSFMDDGIKENKRVQRAR